MEEKIFGYCGSKCKHEIYTKEEINNLIEQKINDIAVLTTNPNTTQNYPDGYSYTNCVVISVMYNNTFIVSNTSDNIVVRLRDTNIRVDGPDSTSTVKIVLMKIS